MLRTACTLAVVAVLAGSWPLSAAPPRRARKAAATPAPSLPPPAQAAAAAAGFRARVDQYVELQKRAREGLPKLKPGATPEEIARYEADLRARIKALRAGARRGVIFTPEAETLFRAILAQELRGPAAEPARETAAEGNPTVEKEGKGTVVLAVNGTYDGAPLSSVPPSLLHRLPELPAELAYRFVGRALTLRDRHAAMIVDYLPHATVIDLPEE